MAKVIVMPKLGLTMTEGTLSKWLKHEGEAVKEGEPLFEVETDKLTNTIEASASGTLLKIAVPEGGEAPCMAPVAVIGEPGEDYASLLGGAEEKPAPEGDKPAAPPPPPPAPPGPPARGCSPPLPPRSSRRSSASTSRSCPAPAPGAASPRTT